jgi:trigger factor
MTQIQVEDLSSIKKKLTFEIPEERVASVLDAEYRQLKKTVQIKGFRKGKVPLNILKTYFKSKVEADATRKMIEETFQPGLDEKRISLVSVISLDPEAMQEGQPFKYTAEIEVPPPIEIHGYKGLKLKKVIREATDWQVQERLENLRERFASLNPIPDARGLQQGDYLIVDIKAQVDGEEVSALAVSDYHMELGRQYYLPDFDANLYGMKPDETRTLTLELPEDFPRKSLAGKRAEFLVTVKEAKVRVLPNLDDDFAKDVGEFENLEQVKKEIREDLVRMNENEMKREVKDQIIDHLMEMTPFEVPESMVDDQVDTMVIQSLENFVAQGIDPKRFPPPTKEQRDQMRPSALRSVKAGLIFQAISKQEGLEVSDEELQEGIEARARALGLSPDLLRDQLEEDKRLVGFRNVLLEDKVCKMIEDHADVTEELAAGEERQEEANTEKE